MFFCCFFLTAILLQRKVFCEWVMRGESDLDLVSDEKSVTRFLLWLKHEPPLPSEQRQRQRKRTPL